MENISSVLVRRSIRAFTNEKLTREELMALVEAGMAAACARGRTSWHFTIIQDRDTLDRIPDVHPFSMMMRSANAAILICADRKSEPNEGYWVQNCSAATENVLIEAARRDIGSVWLGVYPMKKRIDGVRKLMNVPDDLIPFSLVALGKPDEIKPPHSGVDKDRLKWGPW